MNINTGPERMDRLSKSVFREIYPLIASQIVGRCGVKKGVCIDVGSGPGALAISVAKITDLKIYSLDISDKMQEIAIANIENKGLKHEIFPVKGDVHSLPFSDDFADLIISRGSMFFWENKETSFREIYRVLKPDGFAYIGGGFGSAELREKIKKSSAKNQNSDHVKIPKVNVEELEKILNHAEIKNYQIINDGSGLWVLFKKPSNT